MHKDLLLTHLSVYEFVCAIAHGCALTRRPAEAAKRPLLLPSTFSFEKRSFSLYLGFIFSQLDWNPKSLRYLPASTFLSTVVTSVRGPLSCSELELHLCVDPCLVPSVLGSELFTLQQLHLTARPLWLTSISWPPALAPVLIFIFCESQFPILWQNTVPGDLLVSNRKGGVLGSAETK